LICWASSWRMKRVVGWGRDGVAGSVMLVVHFHRFMGN
jgi:hypothetical protein